MIFVRGLKKISLTCGYNTCTGLGIKLRFSRCNVPPIPYSTSTPPTPIRQANMALIFNKKTITQQEYTYSSKSREMPLKRKIELQYKHKIKALTDCMISNLPRLIFCAATQSMNPLYTVYRQHNSYQGCTQIRSAPYCPLQTALNHTSHKIQTDQNRYHRHLIQ